MEKVTGIGGIFFRARDPKALAAWYNQHLGVNPVPSGPDQQAWTQEAGETAFSPFPADTKYFGDASRAWMINFRVKNLDALVAQLTAAGVEVKVDPEHYPYGRFARTHDPEGNPIELWQPEAE
jgi:glyoxylase I family protein